METMKYEEPGKMLSFSLPHHNSSFAINSDEGSLSSPSKPHGMDYAATTTFNAPTDEINYFEAKKIRQLVEKDVNLLRNRVRMLQIEE